MLGAPPPRPSVPGASRQRGRCWHEGSATVPQLLRAVQAVIGRPRKGCLMPLRGAPWVRRWASPGCPPPGQAVGVRCPRVWGARVRARHCPYGLRALRVVARRRSGGRRSSWGGVSSHCCEGRLVSGTFPLPAACPWERVDRPRCTYSPGAGGVRVRTRHRPHSMGSRGPALSAVGLSGGVLRRMHRAVVKGVWCQGRSLSRPPVPGGR